MIRLAQYAFLSLAVCRDCMVGTCLDRFLERFLSLKFRRYSPLAGPGRSTRHLGRFRSRSCRFRASHVIGPPASCARSWDEKRRVQKCRVCLCSDLFQQLVREVNEAIIWAHFRRGVVGLQFLAALGAGRGRRGVLGTPRAARGDALRIFVTLRVCDRASSHCRKASHSLDLAGHWRNKKPKVLCISRSAARNSLLCRFRPAYRAYGHAGHIL